MKRKIHVVPHTHWDREWYFTTARSKVYLMKDVKDILKTLENNQEFKYYVLDAQASLLEDYLKWVPEDRNRIIKLVNDKKLIIGPWYTQSDQLVISGESIVRNLYYGMKYCESLGGYMNIGYVPDSFGQSGNMPQIYRQFGINETLFWRGVSDDMVKHTEFNWKGDDGSVVFAVQIPFGYYIGGLIPEDMEDNDRFWKEECFDRLVDKATTNHIYFPNGFDQAPIRTNLPELLKLRNQRDLNNHYEISSIENYINDVLACHPELEEVTGELVIAKHMRIHKSIFSSRSDLKAMNTMIQNYLTNTLEPLLSISYSLGNEYPHGAIKEIWKLLFENAAHDSIGSCVSDTTNEDVYTRYKQARDFAINLVELHSRLIATNIKNKSEINFTIINTLPKQRSEMAVCQVYLPNQTFALKDHEGRKINYSIIKQKDLTKYMKAQIIRLNPSQEIYIPEQIMESTIAIDTRDIPGMGYAEYRIDLEGNSYCEIDKLNKLENQYYIIEVNGNGSLTITDKENNHIYKNQAVLVENGDDGDSFNYSPPREDLKVYSTDSEFSFQMEGSKLYQKAKIDFEMMVPSDLNERAQGNVSVKLPISMEVCLKKGSKIIDFNISVNNTVLSHRLCVLFDGEIMSKFNFADQQFGLIKRPNIYEKEMKLYLEGLGNKKEIDTSKAVELANFMNDQSTWQEPPISIETMQSYVSIDDEHRGIAVFPKGVREYEVQGEQGNLISLTIFRTYGFMGKENLVNRPGRASGETAIATPNAQLLKEMEFSFGFATYCGSINKGDIDLLAKDYNTNLEVYQYASFLNGRAIFSQQEVDGVLDKCYSLFESDNNLVISAIKKAEDQEGYIIRLYNGKDHLKLSEVLRFNQPIGEAYYTNLKEDKLEEIEITDNTITIKSLTHCQFVTIYVK